MTINIPNFADLDDDKLEEESKKFGGFAHLDEHIAPKQLRELRTLLAEVHPKLDLSFFEKHFVSKQTDLRVKSDYNNNQITSIAEDVRALAILIKDGVINPYKLSVLDFLNKDILPVELEMQIIRDNRNYGDEELSKDLKDISFEDFTRLTRDKERLKTFIIAGATLTSAIRELPPEQLGAKSTLKNDISAPYLDGLNDAHRAIGRLLNLVGADLSHAGKTAALIDGISDTLEARIIKAAQHVQLKGPQ